MKIPQSTKKQARIEMLPLIDVVFLLLVFFIYAMLSMVIHRGIPINLPKAESVLINKKDYISIVVSKEGYIYLNKRKVSSQELKSLLVREKDLNPNIKIFVSGDRKSYYERVVEVLDIVRISGLSKISLETELKDEI